MKRYNRPGVYNPIEDRIALAKDPYDIKEGHAQVVQDNDWFKYLEPEDLYGELDEFEKEQVAKGEIDEADHKREMNWRALRYLKNFIRFGAFSKAAEPKLMYINADKINSGLLERFLNELGLPLDSKIELENNDEEPVFNGTLSDYLFEEARPKRLASRMRKY